MIDPSSTGLDLGVLGDSGVGLAAELSTGFVMQENCVNYEDV